MLESVPMVMPLKALTYYIQLNVHAKGELMRCSFDMLLGASKPWHTCVPCPVYDPSTLHTLPMRVLAPLGLFTPPHTFNIIMVVVLVDIECHTHRLVPSA